MVMLVPIASFFAGKSVLITGHTGFKGGWLATWLKRLEARVAGFSLPPEDGKPSLFEVARVADNMDSVLGDIRDCSALTSAFQTHEPEIVFHLAAQSLVRRSYRDPLDTISTNVMGTVHVLEAVRKTPSVRVVVVVTSDKCYENREWVYAYRENDPMGGYDTYSSSKGAAELLTASYRDSFFRNGKRPVAVSSVRAGNVMGGGDWAEDRLVPDCMRALADERQIAVRSPESIRPWQHVLEPLAGYLWLAACMWDDPVRYPGGWNFGPDCTANASVRSVVTRVIEAWGSGQWKDLSEDRAQAPHEAACLRLDCTKAASLLHWRPALSLRDCVQQTVEWYRRYYSERGFDGEAFTASQIEAYAETARRAGLPWAGGCTEPTGSDAHSWRRRRSADP